MNIKKHFSNILFGLVLIFFIVKKAPSIIEMYKSQGETSPLSTVYKLSDQSEISIPINRKQILVFWATWCGPCKVELARVNKMVKSGHIPKDFVLAISISEDPKTVAEFVKAEDYQFDVALDESGRAAEAYKVVGTPTVVFIDEKKRINWMTTGLSPSLEFRFKSFYKDE